VTPRPNGDEDGAVLLMVVAAVLFIAIAFGALLTYQSSSMNAQGIYQDKRSEDLSADAALDVAIAQLQADRTKTCDGSKLLTYAPSGDNIDVYCMPNNTITGAERDVTLSARSGTTDVATAHVTLYDRVGGSGPSVVDISSWSRS
jgi:hypothetical protein